MPPQRRPNRPDARPPRAFLFPEFLARTTDFALVLGLVRARALPRKVMAHRFVQQVLVHLGREHFVRKLHLPYGLAF